jgi:hypothetical protein
MPTWYSARNGNQENIRNYQQRLNAGVHNSKLRANCPWNDPRCMGGHQSACLEACAKNCELTAPGVPEPPLCSPSNPNYPNCELTAPGTPTHNYRLNSAQTNNTQCRDECWASCPDHWSHSRCGSHCRTQCELTAPGTPDSPWVPPRS